MGASRVVVDADGGIALGATLIAGGMSVGLGDEKFVIDEDGSTHIPGTLEVVGAAQFSGNMEFRTENMISNYATSGDTERPAAGSTSGVHTAMYPSDVIQLPQPTVVITISDYDSEALTLVGAPVTTGALAYEGYTLSSVDGAYTGARLVHGSELVTITDYDGSTQTFTIGSAFTSAPSDGSTGTIYGTLFVGLGHDATNHVVGVQGYATAPTANSTPIEYARMRTGDVELAPGHREGALRFGTGTGTDTEPIRVLRSTDHLSLLYQRYDATAGTWDTGMSVTFD
jgi:hypothetical protein